MESPKQCRSNPIVHRMASRSSYGTSSSGSAIDAAFLSTCSSDLYHHGGPEIEEIGSPRWLSFLGLKSPRQSCSEINTESEERTTAPPARFRRLRARVGSQVAQGSDSGSSLAPRPPPSSPIHGANYFSMDMSSSKTSYMLSARELDIREADNSYHWRWKQDPDSRYPDVAELVTVRWLEINGKIHSSLLSPRTIYVVYLIYKLNPGSRGGLSYLKATIEYNGVTMDSVVSLDSAMLEMYEGGNSWSQIKIGTFYNNAANAHFVRAKITGSEGKVRKSGLIIEGLGFKAQY